MARYEVFMTERNYGSVMVEADSPDDASGIAEEMYLNGDVEWGKLDFQVVGVKEVDGGDEA